MCMTRLVFFTVIVLFALGSQASPQTDPLDAKALQDLYRALNIPSQLKQWKTDDGDPCAESWTGVTCNGLSIIHLIIPGLQFGGNLGFQLSNLHNLKKLDISSNHLQGIIPFNLPANVTHLNLADNNFSQNMPYSLTNIKHLRHLNVSHNSLSGPIGDVFTALTNLKEMDLSSDNFTGYLPSSFGSLKNLTRLFFESNGCTGSVIFLSNFSLYDLDIQDNHLVHICYPSHYAYKHKNKGLGPGGNASIVGGFTLLAACAAFYAVARFQQRGRRLRRLQGSHSLWQSLPVSTARDFSSTAPEDSSEVLAISSPLMIDPKYLPPLRTRTVGKSRRSFSRKSRIPIGTKIYSVAELQAATDSFSKSNLLGEGSLGSVYKAEFPGGQIFAVKNVNTVALALHEEEKFLDLIRNVARLRHPNIVKLVGYCVEHGQHILVYEHVRHLSLDDALHCDSCTPLSWGLRLRVALRVARALNYLHTTCMPPVAHSNLKAANILLDEDLMPHICDTGLAVLKPLTSNKIKIKASEMAIGDTGYIAPEPIQSGIGNMKGDVYAFGVLLLELLTGRRPFDSSKPRAEQSLVNWASSQLHDNESLEKMVDAAIKRTIPSKALSRFADIISLCIQPRKEFRPPMTEIQEALICILQENHILRGFSAGNDSEGPLDRSFRRFKYCVPFTSSGVKQRRVHDYMKPAGAKVGVIDFGHKGKLSDIDMQSFERLPIDQVFHSPECESHFDARLSAHGFSCASIICGARRDVNFFDISKHTIEGVYPAAQLYTYALGCGGCASSNLTIDAIGQAQHDGVKVVSMSVGSKVQFFRNIDDPRNDMDGMKMLEASKDMLICTPVGNDGPARGSAVCGYPWGITVGACTAAEILVAELEIAIKARIPSVKVLETRKCGDETFMITHRFQGVSLNTIETQFLELRLEEDEKWRRNEYVLVASRSVGICVLLPPAPHLRNKAVVPSVSSLSRVLLDKVDIGELRNLHENALGEKIFVRILKSRFIKDERGVFIPHFSSRGPSKLFKDHILPDVVAPGYAVRMAHPSDIPLNYEECQDPSFSSLADVEPMYSDNTVGSGTSFAVPYVAACALAVWSKYPHLKPSAIKSALVTTSRSFASDCISGDEFAYGAGSIDLDSALYPGLVYEENHDRFVDFLDDRCEISDLNLPSFAASFSYSHKKCKKIFKRRLKDVGLGEGEKDLVYTSKIIYFNRSLDPAVEIKVEPSVLEFKRGEEKGYVLSVEIHPRPDPRLSICAMIQWTPKRPGQTVSSPIHLFHQSELDRSLWYETEDGDKDKDKNKNEDGDKDKDKNKNVMPVE